jgi:1-deoxy-D-xylulose 5-phosphate reductoisomerase
MNAANEILVNRFLSKELSWSEIGSKLEKLMERHQPESELNLEKIMTIDTLARIEAKEV